MDLGKALSLVVDLKDPDTCNHIERFNKVENITEYLTYWESIIAHFVIDHPHVAFESEIEIWEFPLIDKPYHVSNCYWHEFIQKTGLLCRTISQECWNSLCIQSKYHECYHNKDIPPNELFNIKKDEIQLAAYLGRFTQALRWGSFIQLYCPLLKEEDEIYQMFVIRATGATIFMLLITSCYWYNTDEKYEKSIKHFEAILSLMSSNPNVFQSPSMIILKRHTETMLTLAKAHLAIKQGEPAEALGYLEILSTNIKYTEEEYDYMNKAKIANTKPKITKTEKKNNKKEEVLFYDYTPSTIQYFKFLRPKPPPPPAPKPTEPAETPIVMAKEKLKQVVLL